MTQRDRERINKAIADRKAYDVARLKDPDTWPNWPVVPVKKYEGGRLKCALVFERGKGLAFYEGFNLWDPEVNDKLKRAEPVIVTPEQLIFGMGWEVD